MAARVKNVQSLVRSLSAVQQILQIVPAPVLHSTRPIHTSVKLQGGRPKSFWRTKRHPANTRIDHELPEKIKDRKAFGGHRKWKALRVNKGCFTWESLGVVDLETPIVSVVHSQANKQHVGRNIIVKGSIVQIDASPFRTWYESQKEQHDKGKIQPRDDERLSLLNKDMLYARISTRPGQVGTCNGYILEGKDLEDIQSILKQMTTESRTD